MAGPISPNNRTRENEENKFSADINGDTAVNVIVSQGGVGTSPGVVKIFAPITATPSTVTPVTTLEREISPIAGQTFIALNPTTGGAYHVRLASGVTTDSTQFTKGNPVLIENWGGSTFVRKASGSGALEVTQG